MIKFIDKLIEETQQGILDYVWEYYGDDRFKYNADKHPLKDLNFSLKDVVFKEEIKDNGKKKIVPDETKASIVFPNGAGLDVERSRLEVLNAECHNAILRAMENISFKYANGTIQKEIETAKAKALEDKEKKNKESSEKKGRFITEDDLTKSIEEKPINEKQANKTKV